MVDKLRKAGLWLWLFKERIILIVMVGALANQVYLLLTPATEVAKKPLPAPRRELDETAVDPSIIPPSPPPLPPIGPPPPSPGLSERNPFWYYSSSGTDRKSSDVPADLIQLVRIQKIGDRVRCQLRTRSTTKWYEVGDRFEEFVLQEIDFEAQTVTVFSEQYGKPVTLQPQG